MKKLIPVSFIFLLSLSPLACLRPVGVAPSSPSPSETSTWTPTVTFTPGCQYAGALTSVSIPAPSYLYNLAGFPGSGVIVIGSSPTPSPTDTPVPTITPVIYINHFNSFTVIRSHADWAVYCVSASGTTVIPPDPVNFSNQMIIADYICGGYCGNSRLSLVSLCWQSGLILVNEVRTQNCPLECAAPAPWMMFQCYPTGFAYAVPQSNLPVKFSVTGLDICATPPVVYATPTVTIVP